MIKKDDDKKEMLFLTMFGLVVASGAMLDASAPNTACALFLGACVCLVRFVFVYVLAITTSPNKAPDDISIGS